MAAAKTCPDCRKDGFKTPAGDHPAGRCDACHADIESRRACCTDCLAEGRSPKKCMPVNPDMPGRRCLTHGRAAKKRRKAAAHAYRTEKNFGLTAEDYQRLYQAQGGRCYVCRVATGKRKMLAVDHEHNRPGCTHPPEKGCYLCVRCLACGPCNQMLGRYGPDKLRRAIEVHENPPARKVLLDS